MQPIVEQLADDENTSVDVYQVDVDKMQDLADMFANDGVPTFVLFSKGIPKAIETGEKSIDELTAMVA